MNEFKEIENLLNIVKSRIDAHLKFKKEYDKQLAFDFSLFQFFTIGENKISQVLAYFLDENQNHGQGNIFLKEFVKTFYDKEIEVQQLENICEKIITENRRIDIYIKLKGLTIAIENKIWADDQKNQLKDYSTFLEQKSKGNYLLLYLNPYGLEPTTNSIKEKLKENLIEQKKLKIISYKDDIISLINNWLVICEADNVSHFLKEFKKYLEIKFLGKNTLNMSKELRTIIHENEREVQHLVNEYKGIENDILSKLNSVGKELDKSQADLNFGVEISKSGLFNWNGSRVYKYSISKNGNKIWVQFVKEEIHLYLNYYLQEGTDSVFKEILTGLNFTANTEINYNQSISELVNIFLNHVKVANESFRIYDEQKENE
ncbi:PDDEXK-like family protein [Lutibacter flavus]|uniref:PD-(D/E)XK nuclease superfamily protein n=1 Tax=Lutibacter flavus TaxID=691689 RepID=A0A238Y8D5_9FLAO|nr:PD-(D/E)XK nuclease family protein [Lutibacter flavus]SNR67031.1 PD-(D/E)XK nuclease superfamily protein [Lutibacter flavus]